MEEIIILNLRRIGHLETCQIVPDKTDANLWNLQVTALAGQGGESNFLKTQRGSIRTFSSIDTTFKTAIKLGFNEAKIISNKIE